MENMKNVLGEVGNSIKTLSKEYPDFTKAFHSFAVESEKEGALSHKVKELIAVALSITAHCKWCIASHINNALKAGATKDEIMEACFVAALMGGGPALMYTQLAVKAVEDFNK